MIPIANRRTATALFWHLESRKGHIVSRTEILREVFGLPPDVRTRRIDVHVCELRRVIGKARCPIVTVRGRGYKFEPNGGGGRKRGGWGKKPGKGGIEP